MQEMSLSQIFLKLVQDRKGHFQDDPFGSNYSRSHFRDKGLVIAAVGGGGKTSILYLLASAFAREGRRVCLTTTTHMYDPRTEAESHPFDRVLILPELADEPGTVTGSNLGPQANERPAALALSSLAPQAGSITVLASQEGIRDTSVHQPGYDHARPLFKLGGIHPDRVATLRAFWDVVLVEADGSKHLPVKAPADHEPLIPAGTDVVLGCIGLDCLGKPLDEHSVHRPALFSAITGCGAGAPISVQHLINLIGHPQGLFKAAPRSAQRVLLLNKVDLLAEKALQELKTVFESPVLKGKLSVLLGSVRHNYVLLQESIV